MTRAIVKAFENRTPLSGVDPDDEHDEKCGPDCGHKQPQDDDDDEDDDNENDDEDEKSTPTNKAIGKMLKVSKEAQTILTFLNDNFFNHVSIVDEDMAPRVPSGRTQHQPGMYADTGDGNNNNDDDDSDDEDDADIAEDEDDDEGEGEKELSDEKKKKMSRFASALYANKWAALHFLAAILKVETTYLEEARENKYWIPNQSNAMQEATGDGISNKLPSEDAETAARSSSSSSSPTDDIDFDEDNDGDASDAATPESLEADKRLAFLNKHRFACRKLFTLLPLGKMKSVFITLQPGFEGMLKHSSRDALISAQTKLRNAWKAIGVENLKAGKPRGALADRVAIGQPDLFEVAFHLLGARDGEGRQFKETRTKRIMTDAHAINVFFFKRPTSGGADSSYYNARRDGERSPGGLPEKLKVPVSLVELDAKTAEAQLKKQEAKGKKEASEDILKSAKASLQEGADNLITCDICSGSSNCLHTDCNCITTKPFPFYCNLACGCKCGRKCRNKLLWRYDENLPDLDCCVAECTHKDDQIRTFQCHDDNVDTQNYLQPSTSCGRYFHRSCAGVNAPSTLCPSCAAQPSRMENGQTLIGLRAEYAKAEKEKNQAVKSFKTAEEKTVEAKKRSDKANTKQASSSNTTTALPTTTSPHVFLASIRSSLLNIKGRVAVLDTNGHVRISPPAAEDPLSRTVRTLVGDGALLGQVHPIANALLSSLPLSCICDNALVRGERKESKTRSMALDLFIFGPMCIFSLPSSKSVRAISLRSVSST